MVRKVMALSALTLMTGIVTTLTTGGCTTSDGGAPDTDGGPGDAQNERKIDTDSGEPEEPVACPQNVALTVADLDKEIGFKPAVAQPGACSQADLTKLEANFKDTNITSYFDLGSGLDETCKTCVFSKDTDANWAPIVGTAENNGQTGFINFGACFGEVEGEACGKALQYEQFCYNVACNECATTQTERTKCIQAAGDGMCKDFGATTGAACPKLQETAKSCNGVFDAVKTLCGSQADAGTDGGP